MRSSTVLKGDLIEFVQNKSVYLGDLEHLVTSGSEAKGIRDMDPTWDALKTLNEYRTYDTTVHRPLSGSTFVCIQILKDAVNFTVLE